MSETKVVEENGVTIRLTANHDNPRNCKTFYNPVMTICREFVFTALLAYCEDATNAVGCLDAFAATGIGGLQWKRHLGSKVKVTINENDKTSVEEIRLNCAKNNITVGAGQKPADGNVTDETQQSQNATGAEQQSTVRVVRGDANVLMHQRQFHFIHLDPYGSTVQYMDAAFRNIYNKGVLVLTSTDVASLYGKCSQVTLRNYNAYTTKTDYMKEVAARVLIAAAVRAAARCNKGVEVLYTVAVEHFIQVALYINRGATHADASVRELRPVLHCQMCEEWAVCPDSHAPVENMYSLLPCECHKENDNSKTAVMLGPMWCGALYSPPFLQKMFASATKHKQLSDRLRSLLGVMMMEADCESGQPQAVDSHDKTPEDATANEMKAGSKRGCGDAADVGECKRLKTSGESREDEMPMFYYNLHRRKMKGVDLPKSHTMVALLHKEGFRASRTHFEPMAVRTNANLSQLRTMLQKHHGQPC